MSTLSDAAGPIIGIGVTVAGAFALRWLERRSAVQEKHPNPEGEFRGDLLDRVETLTTQVDAMRKEADTWRQKYWDMHRTLLKLENDNLELQRQIRELQISRDGRH